MAQRAIERQCAGGGTEHVRDDVKRVVAVVLERAAGDDARGLAAEKHLQLPHAAGQTGWRVIDAGQWIVFDGDGDGAERVRVGTDVAGKNCDENGRPADGLLAQLNAFASGQRTNDAAGKMRWIAAKLTPQERARIAEYFESLASSIEAI